MVVAIPSPPLIEGDNEEIRPLKSLELFLSFLFTGHGVAKRSGHLVENGGLEQELLRRSRLARYHFVGNIVHDEPIVASKTIDEGVSAASVSNRQGRQLKPGNPAFGALMEGHDLIVRKLQIHGAVEKTFRLVATETKIRCGDLVQLLPNPHPRETHRRIRSAAKHKVDGGRYVLDEELECLMHTALLYKMKVI